MNTGFLYTQVFDALMEEIVSGMYKSGDILSSEKILCAKYDVSLITVRRALKALEDAGIIYKMKGKGSIVNADIRKTDTAVNKNIGILDLDWSGLKNVTYPIPPFDIEIYNQNEWKNILYSSIYKKLSDKYNLIVGAYDRNDIIEHFNDTVFTNVQRIFIIGIYTKELIEFLHSQGKLVVVYNNFDKNIPVCSVSNDERKKVGELVEELIRLGHRRIAAINGDINFSESVERFMGFQESLMKNSIPVQSALIKWGNMSSQSGYHLARQILSSGEIPTAIVCVNDNVAAGCLYAVKEVGLRCPEDISIIGHDNVVKLHSFTEPIITSINPKYELVGEKIAEKLTREIWFDDYSVVESEIMIRDSITKVKD